MKLNIVHNPPEEQWASLFQRPALDVTPLFDTVRSIMEDVRMSGDSAVIGYTAKFDGVSIDSLEVSADEIRSAGGYLSDALKAAISQAASNIEAFHAAQLGSEPRIETMPGVECWRKSVAIEKVGLYIPGGTAPLFSSVLMLGIPAKLAGCRDIVLCTPPGADGHVHPAILFAADLIGITKVIKAGGAQAIAAMAYGTQSVPKVDKIFGPGNQYVTAAKQLASLEGTAIDMPAGPSEVAVIADRTAEPSFVAADLLSQAEHGHDSQVILFTDESSMVDAIQQEIDIQLATLPRRKMAESSLSNSRVFIVPDMDRAMEMSNAYAPEHLIIATENAEELAGKVSNAGSVFLGHYTPESAGDYASGTNHTLPTNGAARSYSGVSVDSYMKKITFQAISPEGIRRIGDTIIEMAEAEELRAHALAVRLRKEKLTENGN